MKRLYFLIISIFILMGSINAHPWKPDCFVIIDTDCGLDDFRAINLMLDSPNVQILAITTSNGVIDAKSGFLKVKNFLNSNHHEGILLGANVSDQPKSMNCKPALSFTWGSSKMNENTDIVSFTEVLNRVFQNCNEKIISINLGSLNTMSTYLNQQAENKEKIKEVLWTGSSDQLKEGFNYKVDTSAFYSFQKLSISLKIINPGLTDKYSNELITKIKTQNSDISLKIMKSLTVPNAPFSKNLYDESSFIYLSKPGYFIQTISENITYYKLSEDSVSEEIFENLILGNSKNTMQVLSRFSLDSSSYLSDVGSIMKSAIKNFGMDEWVSCVLTGELHRHLGVYSLVGAKMGVRAKEYFGVGPDEIKVVSYAGSQPPFSCLNDGLQVSTGATIGQGMISVIEDSKLPKAEFYYLGQKITISLRDEYRNKIASEIKELSFIYGLDNNIYWDLVRKLAIKYWANWSRYDIFDIEVQKK